MVVLIYILSVKFHREPGVPHTSVLVLSHEACHKAIFMCIPTIDSFFGLGKYCNGHVGRVKQVASKVDHAVSSLCTIDIKR